MRRRTRQHAATALEARCQELEETIARAQAELNEIRTLHATVMSTISATEVPRVAFVNDEVRDISVIPMDPDDIVARETPSPVKLALRQRWLANRATKHKQPNVLQAPPVPPPAPKTMRSAHAPMAAPSMDSTMARLNATNPLASRTPVQRSTLSLSMSSAALPVKCQQAVATTDPTLALLSATMPPRANTTYSKIPTQHASFHAIPLCSPMTSDPAAFPPRRARRYGRSIAGATTLLSTM